MHRRAFAAALLAGPLARNAPDLRACDIPAPAEPAASPVPDVPLEQAERSFRWPDDEGPRSLWIRVEEYTSLVAATAGQDAWMARAVPEALPQGEFYGSGLQVIEVQDVPAAADVRLHTWHTIVGVAAFTTATAAFTARYGARLWAGIVVASDPAIAVGLAADLIAFTQAIPAPCSGLEGMLPDVDDLPEGARREDVP